MTYTELLTGALDTAAATFKATLRELGLSGDEPELDDGARLGRRAALVAAASVLWQRQLGPLLDIRQAMELLGVGSRQAVHDLIQRNRLLAVTTEEHRTLMPVFQFSEQGRPYEAVPPILRIFAEADATGWTVASWFTTPSPELANETPITRIRTGRDLENVLEAARVAAAPLRW
ncbi:MAG: DUF2384 domain-containing protein [Chloroflexi bacterium]|nr:DUF2384 domain-containing protein [Chloroflexota bacterium]MBV9547201.1 DUF2384 domain-containing protein [Chloroflexota bacterium]